MDLTLLRPDERIEPSRTRAKRLRTLAAGPLPVLITACILATAFLVALSDLVSRLG
jgi:hypothetical protein